MMLTVIIESNADLFQFYASIDIMKWLHLSLGLAIGLLLSYAFNKVV